MLGRDKEKTERTRNPRNIENVEKRTETLVRRTVAWRHNEPLRLILYVRGLPLLNRFNLCLSPVSSALHSLQRRWGDSQTTPPEQGWIRGKYDR